MLKEIMDREKLEGKPHHFMVSCEYAVLYVCYATAMHSFMN